MFTTNIKRAGGWLLLTAIAAAFVLLQVATSASATGTTFVVTSAADPGDGSCGIAPGDCTLREAINAANANLNPGETDRIEFEIGTGGVETITLSSSLPQIVEPVIIDGTTQGPAVCGAHSLFVEVVGPSWGAALTVRGSGTTIRGLAIGGSGAAIQLSGSGHTVECNNLGTGASGAVASPNNSGIILLDSDSNTIGSAVSPNLLAHNGTSQQCSQSSGAALVLWHDPSGNGANGNFIRYNDIRSNASGISIEGPHSGNLIEHNTIVGTASIALSLHSGAHDNTVRFNNIGAWPNGDAGGNCRGISITSGPFNIGVLNTVDNSIEDNVVANNGGDTGFQSPDAGYGILVAPGLTSLMPVGNTLRRNSLYNNQGSGINASVAQNPPYISSAYLTGGNTAITGSVTGEADSLTTLELFKSPTCDSSGSGEGQTYIAFVLVSIPAGESGNQFSLILDSLAPGEALTATATRPDGTTSTFSNCTPVVPLEAETYVVNTEADDNDGDCNGDSGDCTLREAIIAANGHPNAGIEPDRIEFAIPGAGPHRITVPGAGNTLYASGPVVIDGLTQPGAQCDAGGRNLLIEIVGDSSAGAVGIALTGASTLRGVAVGSFGLNGNGAGVYLSGQGNVVECNNIGLSADGTQVLPNVTGVFLSDSSNNVIGSTELALRNVISGNGAGTCSSGNGAGVVLYQGQNGGSHNNDIIGNYFGTTPDGLTAVGGSAGVMINGSNNRVGQAGAGNLFANHTSMGVNIFNSAIGTVVEANNIGVNAVGAPAGNCKGISAAGTGTQVRGNLVQNNGGDNGYGVLNFGALVTGNRIFNNQGQGIQSGVQSGFTTTRPTVLSVGQPDASDTVQVSARLTDPSVANVSLRFEFFASQTCDGSGAGEGQVFLGALDQTADGSGSATATRFVGPVPTGWVVTVTASRLDSNITGLFSSCGRYIPAGPYIVNTVSDTYDGDCSASHCTLREAMAWANAHPNVGGIADRIEFNIGGPELVKTIVLIANQLPSMTDPVTIDGLSQPGSQCTSTGLLVEVQGNGSLSGGMQIDPGADGTTIQGLALGGFTNGNGRAVMVIRANDNTIGCNHVGTHADGTPFANAKGVAINDSNVRSDNNLVELNTIANHTVYGVTVGATYQVPNPLPPPAPAFISVPRVGNEFRQNSIYNNPGGGLGTSSFFTPQISSATVPAGESSTVTVAAFIQAAGVPTTFEFFASQSCDASYSGGGERYLTTSQSTSGADLVARTTIPVGPIPEGWVITATATREDTHTTSGFSRCILPSMAVTSISPPTVEWGSAATTVTLHGTGFVSDSVVLASGNAPSPTPTLIPVSVTSTEIVVEIPANVLGDTRRGGVQLIVRRPVLAGGGAATSKSLNLASRIDAVSPGSITAPSADVPITVTGVGFQDYQFGNHKIFVRSSNDLAPAQELPTTFVNTGTLQAWVPSALLQSGGTLEVTVRHITANGSVSSNLFPIFVTAQAAPVTAITAETATTETVVEVVTADVVSGTSVEAVTDSGTGTVAVAVYESNPGAVPAFALSTATAGGDAAGTFVDVYVSPASTFTETTIQVCDTVGGGDVLYWFNGTQWLAAWPQVHDSYTGCTSVTVSDDPLLSSPTIGQLQGTPVALSIGWAPVIESVSPTASVVALGTAVTMSAMFADNDLPTDSHGAAWDWGDGTQTTAVVSGSTGTDREVAGTRNYESAGVYRVTLTVTDSQDATDEEQYLYVVVYDPSAGFVTGGGWIDSPAGAYAAHETLTGKATFGFVSQYKKGANVPTGNTQFQFHAAGLDFKSTSYDWLVIAGARAQYKGVGTINGQGSYRFMLTAIDGQVNGGGGVDKFRIRIWSDNGLVYDNQLGAPDDADPTTAIGGGSIVIHK